MRAAPSTRTVSTCDRLIHGVYSETRFVKLKVKQELH